MMRGGGDDSQNLKWEAHGVGLVWVSWSVVEADDSTPRANPGHGIEK